MKTKFGAIVVSGSGKLGGHIFTGSGVRSAMSTKSIQVNKRSVRQSSQRAFVTYLSSLWRELNEQERASWDSSAVIENKNNNSDTKGNISGFNLFVSCNLNLKALGSPVLRLCGKREAIPPYVITLTNIQTNNFIYYNVTSLPSSIPYKAIMYIGYKRSAGAKMTEKDMVFGSVATSSGSLFASSGSLIDRLGFFNPVFTYYVGFRIVDASGFSTPLIFAKAGLA